MIPIQEADALLRPFHRALPPARVPLERAFGLTLREDIRSDRPYPPLDRVCMDGVAINQEAWRQGVRRFRVEGMAKVGKPRKILAESGSCFEVATGAPCPEGADSVIPYEKLTLEDGRAEVREGTVFRAGQNVCTAGADCTAGAVLVRAGSCLTPPCIGAAASAGHARVLVTPLPRLALLGTGDELVDVEEIPKPWQLRRSNTAALGALFAGLAEIRCLHCGDAPADLALAIGDALEDADLVVLTGGVSAGRYDAVPASLRACGIREIFHKVAIRPGKPVWFGAAGERPVFALPGNPVAALICARRFVLPMLSVMAGLRAPTRRKVRLGADSPGSGLLTHFVPVRLEGHERGLPVAYPVSMHGSGDFAGLVASDGFVEAPGDEDSSRIGRPLPFHPWIAGRSAPA